MTKEWKDGDRAMVRIERMNGRNATLVGNGSYSIDVGSLHPLPPEMTEAVTALVDAALAHRWVKGALFDRLVAAVLSERAPPDPVEVAIAAFLDSPGNTVEGIRTALKAYDAAKGSKS